MTATTRDAMAAAKTRTLVLAKGRRNAEHLR